MNSKIDTFQTYILYKDSILHVINKRSKKNSAQEVKSRFDQVDLHSEKCDA